MFRDLGSVTPFMLNTVWPWVVCLQPDFCPYCGVAPQSSLLQLVICSIWWHSASLLPLLGFSTFLLCGLHSGPSLPSPPRDIPQASLHHLWLIAFNPSPSLGKGLYTFTADCESLSQFWCLPSAHTCFSANLPDVCTWLSHQSLKFSIYGNINGHFSSQPAVLCAYLFSLVRGLLSWSPTLKSLIPPCSLLFISFCLHHPFITASITFCVCISQCRLTTPKSQWFKTERFISPSCCLSIEGD